MPPPHNLNNMRGKGQKEENEGGNWKEEGEIVKFQNWWVEARYCLIRQD